MPNYYIQATRGHFNPLSFDELVKPLNMYKEYYNENEKAVTEMRSQADLWDEIMKSEGDTDLANKYNQYSQGLNDAAQQLSNGMSYNLRKQIQDLRAKSAMVKQIENAYTLRAKDIDTYNELMMKDPSRIGAFDPSQRSLNDYMQGPVTNEYGVSGDRLYSLGNARAKAMSAQKDVFEKPASVLGKQYFELKEKTGYSDEEITQMLKEHNPEIFNEIDRIIQQEGTSLNNASDLNRAETYVLNGMLSGFTFNEDRKYLKDDSYMNDYEKLKYEEEIRGKMLDNELKQAKLADMLGLNPEDVSKYFRSLTDDKIGLFQTNLDYGNAPKKQINDLKDILQKINGVIDNKEGFHFNENGFLMTPAISNEINKIYEYDNDNANDLVDYYKAKQVSQILPKEEMIPGKKYNTSIGGQPVNPAYDEAQKTIERLEKKYINNKNIKEDYKNYKKVLKEREQIENIKTYLDVMHIPGNNMKEQIENLNKFYVESGQVKNVGGLSFKNNTELNAIEGVVDKMLKLDTNLTFKDLDDNKILDKQETKNLLKNDYMIHPSMDGFMITIKNKRYKINTAENNAITNFNDDLFALNQVIRNPFRLVNGKKIIDKKITKENNNLFELDEPDTWNIIDNTNYMYYLYNKNNNLYIHLLNTQSNKETDIKMYDVDSWNNDILNKVMSMSSRIRTRSVNSKDNDLNNND